MKNKFILFTALALWALSSCTKEQVPSGLILKDQKNTKDSTYVISTIPASQSKHILVEEATGVHCSNCPLGAKILRDLKIQYPNKILSVAVYSQFLNDFQAPSKYDFNSTDAMDLVMFIEGKDPSKPYAAIDRLNTGSADFNYFFKLNNWASKIDELLVKTTPLNIELTSTPTINTNEYLISTKTIFTEDWSGDLAMSIYLIEDHVKDYQDSSVVKIPDYEHNHILRKIITPVPGSTFKDATTTKEKGRVYEKFVTFTIPTIPTTTIKKENCHIIAFVHKTGTDKEIIHAQEIELE
jgi:hypothetical protein